MTKTSQSPPQIPRNSPHIGTFAAFRFKNALFRRVINHPQGMNFYFAGFQRNDLTIPRQIISPLAINFNRRKLRRHLLDDTGKAWQQRLDSSDIGPPITLLRHRPLGIIGCGFSTPAHCKPICLLAINHIRHGFCALAECQRQNTGRQRIKRSGMTGFFGIQQPAHSRNCISRGHADRLVENQPTMHIQTLFTRCTHQSSSSS